MFEQNFAFSLVVFVHMRQFQFDFTFFQFFGLDFFLNDFLMHLEPLLGLVFCLVNEN